MKILFLSFINIVKNYDKPFHVDFVRVKEYYNLFINYYKYVDYLCVKKDGKSYMNNIEINFNNINFNNYNFIFIYHEVTIENIKNNYNKIIYNILNVPTFIQLDCNLWEFTKNDEFMSLFKGVGVAYPKAYNNINHINKHLIYNATVKRQQIINNNSNDIVYIGRINDKNKLDKLIIFSEYLKINIDLYTFDNIDKIKKHKYINYKGVLSYNNLYDGLNNSKFGLCFKGSESPVGKIFDYISYGLPVLFENDIGESNIIEDNNLGLSFDMNNLNELILKDFNNINIYNTVVNNHLWINRFEQWKNIIEKYFKNKLII